jgi:ubiquinone/menaquinone biosynthesis C-methylase UbiE
MTDSKDSKSLSQERYTQYAEGYITSQTHAKGADLDRLIAIAELQSDWVILDVATGGGHTALKFAPHVKYVTATDLTPRMLDKAKAFITEQKGIANVAFKQADAENLPFDDEQFDLVTCRIAPHHFPNVQQFVNEGVRVLKMDGILLVQDHVLPEDDESARYVDHFETMRDPSHNRAFNHAEWEAMFKTAGLTIEHTEAFIKRHDFLDWAKRQGNSDAVVATLIQLMNDAPPIAKDWMDAQVWGSESATFVNHHILIRGRKS